MIKNKYVSRLTSIIINNYLINWLWIFLKLDYLPKKTSEAYDWSVRKFREDKSLQENVGYSDLPHISKLIGRSHSEFARFAEEYLKPGARILDIGCGTGLYLKSLNNAGFELHGVDLNEVFLTKARILVSNGNFTRSDFIADYHSNSKFDLISAFGMLMYLEPSKIPPFFNKILEYLNTGGYLYLIYPHAISLRDALYADLTYVRYSPQKIEMELSKKFIILKHEHNYDGRKVRLFDKRKYFFPDGTNRSTDTIENSYLLIARKK